MADINLTDFDLPAEATRFCGVVQSFGMGSAQVKLPSNIVTFRVDGDLPGFSRAELEDACMEGWKRWERCIGIKVDKHANPKTDPTQIVTATRMDGSSGVLADQQLPFGRGVGLLMRIDNGERWIAADNPSQGRINLIAVLCHEDGHCLGFQHINAGGTPDLMNPTYSPRIFVPQPDDISYGRKLYGPPITDVPPPVEPPTVNGKPVQITVEQEGKKWFGTIQRVK
jgi:hypothetical protein